MSNPEELRLNGFSRQDLFDLLEPDFENGILKRKVLSQRFFKSERACRAYNTRFGGKVIEGKDAAGYICFRMFGVYLLAHRVLWFMYYGEVPDIIDHIDGDTSKNTPNNMRNVSHRRNIQNSKTSSSSTTGVKGVHYYKSRNKYTAHITLNYKTTCLGYFSTIDEAITARLEAEEKSDYENFRNKE